MSPLNPSRQSGRSSRGLLVVIVVSAVVLGTLLALRQRSADQTAGTPAASEHAHAHDHDHAHADAHTMPPVPEGGWQTDEPLRTGMSRIRAAVAPVIEAHLENRVTTDDARALTSAINTQFAYMAEHCQLAPDADAALHLVVVQLLQASGHLEEEPQSHEPILAIIGALDTYANAFQHDGWQPIELSH